jgi:hypothetical protein
MNSENQTIFFRAMMTGLFVGIVDTIVCLIYNIAYREFTGYTPSGLINVSSLIFAVNIVLLLIGIIYSVFLRVFRKGDFPFAVFFIGLTILLTLKAIAINRFPDEKLNNDFRGLLGGIILILGISASCLPLLYRSRKFDEFIL